MTVAVSGHTAPTPPATTYPRSPAPIHVDGDPTPPHGISRPQLESDYEYALRVSRLPWTCLYRSGRYAGRGVVGAALRATTLRRWATSVAGVS
jgi:hypothetical protein